MKVVAMVVLILVGLGGSKRGWLDSQGLVGYQDGMGIRCGIGVVIVIADLVCMWFPKTADDDS
jgi:uncharacterized membrane protein